MVWPTAATKTHLDQGTDDAKQARGELATLVDKFNALLGHVSSFMQTFLSRASAADARSDLGLGTAAVKNTGTSGDAVPLLNQLATFSGIVNFGLEVRTPPATLTSSTGIAILMTVASAQFVELDHNTTFTVSGEAVGQWVTVIVKQGTTGGTGAWAGVDAWSGGSAPVLSTTTGQYDVINLFVPEAGIVLGAHGGVFS